MLKPQSCDSCQRRQRFEFVVTDELWERSGCDPCEVLCIECFLARADSNGVKGCNLEDIVFVATVGDGLNAVLLDPGPWKLGSLGKHVGECIEWGGHASEKST